MKIIHTLAMIFALCEISNALTCIEAVGVLRGVNSGNYKEDSTYALYGSNYEEKTGVIIFEYDGQRLSRYNYPSSSYSIDILSDTSQIGTDSPSYYLLTSEKGDSIIEEYYFMETGILYPLSKLVRWKNSSVEILYRNEIDTAEVMEWTMQNDTLKMNRYLWDEISNRIDSVQHTYYVNTFQNKCKELENGVEKRWDDEVLSQTETSFVISRTYDGTIEKYFYSIHLPNGLKIKASKKYYQKWGAPSYDLKGRRQRQ